MRQDTASSSGKLCSGGREGVRACGYACFSTGDGQLLLLPAPAPALSSPPLALLPSPLRAVTPLQRLQLSAVHSGRASRITSARSP
jgi:hypothetical protein